jgi:hypothetical protein
LFGHFQGIIHFDTQVSDGAFQLGMAQKQLYRPKVLSPSVNQRGFGSPEGMRTIIGRVQTDTLATHFDYPGILPSGDVGRAINSAREQEVFASQFSLLDPDHD